MQPLVGWHGYTGATSRARAGTGTISCSVGARPFYKKSPTASCTHKTRGHEKRTCDRTQREAWTDSRKSLHRGKNTQRKLKPTAAASRHQTMLRCRRWRNHRLPHDNQTTRARPHKPCGQAKTHTSMPTVHGWLQTQQLAITAHSDGVRGWSPPAHEASSKRTTPRRHTKLRAAAHVHTHVQQRVESGSTSSGNTTPRAPNTGTQITNRRARPPRHKQSNFFRDRIGTTPTQPPRPPPPEACVGANFTQSLARRAAHASLPHTGGGALHSHHTNKTLAPAVCPTQGSMLPTERAASVKQPPQRVTDLLPPALRGAVSPPMVTRTAADGGSPPPEGRGEPGCERSRRAGHG